MEGLGQQVQAALIGLKEAPKNHHKPIRLSRLVFDEFLASILFMDLPDSMVVFQEPVCGTDRRRVSGAGHGSRHTEGGPISFHRSLPFWALITPPYPSSDRPDNPKRTLSLAAGVPLEGRDLITIDDLSDSEVETLLATARRFDDDGGKAPTILLEGRIVATAFFEPSTRTRLSFEAAAHRLGARVIGFSEAGATSTKKGETLEDTTRTLAGYSDLIVIRHPEAGSARRAADAADVPVVNAGDGSAHHPTQALLDLYTIDKERGRYNDHQIALVGDLLHGRTVHSLAVLLARFGNRLTLVAPPGLEMPSDVVKACEHHGANVQQTQDLAQGIEGSDVVYMTRIQKERFQDPEKAEKATGSYILTPQVLEAARDDITIMHPLPRVDELPTSIDTHPGAAYFRQAQNGVVVRMAVLAHLLTEKLP